MADIINILSNASTSLAAHRGGAATASHNLANSNTPGYARQVANLEAVLPAEYSGRATIGRGADLASVTQYRDAFLEAQLPHAFAAEASASTYAEKLQMVSVFNTEGGAGLSEALNEYYTRLRALAQNPSDMNLRTAAVAAAQNFAITLNRTSTGILSARSGIDVQLTQQVNDANVAMNSVAQLNQKIKLALASHEQPNDLLDARQAALDKLSNLLGATTVPTGGGSVNVVLKDGTTLVAEDKAATLESYADSTLSGHINVQVRPVDGTSAQKVLTSSWGGTFEGLFTARDTALKTAEDALDNFAFDFSNAQNAIHSAGYGLDGGTGRAIFTTTPTASGAAVNLAVDAAIVASPSLLAAAQSPSVLPGDSSQLLLLIDSERGLLTTTGLSPSATLAQTVAQFGAFAQYAKSTAEHQLALKQQFETWRSSVSGVSTDEETAKLIQFQRGYEAVSKVMQVADSMLETLLSIKQG